MTSLEAKILSELKSLHPGKHCPMGDLASQFGITDREVRAAVESLRRQGYLIMSSHDRFNGGYWLASTDEDKKGFVKSYRSGAISRFQTLLAMGGQPELPGLFGK